MIRKAIDMLLLICIVMLSIFGCTGQEQKTEINVSNRLHAFYYPWYGNEAFDGNLRHWNHQVLGIDVKDSAFPGNDDIGANFYPEAGCYSSNDSVVIRKHMSQLVQAGIGVIVVSWWGQGSFEDKTVPLILESADAYDLKVCFHIEPFENRDHLSVREAVSYLNNTYGSFPAFYRWKEFDNRPVYYIYDSYQIPVEDWAKILQPDGEASIRGTADDAVFLGLWVDPDDGQGLFEGGFDGFYSYFAIDGFSYASSPHNWANLKMWADDHDMIFVPCVAPGYDDTRIRPWNSANIRLRQGGEYYDYLFASAVSVIPECIGITSFNEWHEGTQLEPAIPGKISDFKYTDYSPREPDYYLNRTRYWQEVYDSVAHDNSTDRYGNLIQAYLPNDSGIISHLGMSAKIEYLTMYSPKYDGGGVNALINGLRGSDFYRDGRWQGFKKNDFKATLTFDSSVFVKDIVIGCLQHTDAWIFLPEDISISVSTNGVDFTVLPSVKQEVKESDGRVNIPIVCNMGEIRYINIHARNIGVCPEGHYGAGGDAWVFIDEIVIK